MNKQIHKLNLAYHLQHVTSYQNTVTTQWWHTQLKKHVKMNLNPKL